VALQTNEALQTEHLEVANTLNDLSTKHNSVLRAHREATQELGQLKSRHAEVQTSLGEAVVKLGSVSAEHSRLQAVPPDDLVVQQGSLL